MLRFDARTIPGYVVAAALVDAAEEAALEGTAAGWIGFAIVAAVTLALGYAVTRYLDKPMPVHERRIGTRGFDGVELSGRGRPPCARRRRQTFRWLYLIVTQ